MIPRLLWGVLAVGCAAGVEVGAATLVPEGVLGFGGSAAQCDVTNLRGAATPVTMVFTVELPDGSTSTATESATLEPKEVRTIRHVFEAVGPGLRDRAQVSCALAAP